MLKMKVRSSSSNCSYVFLSLSVDYIIFVQSKNPVPLTINREEVEAIQYVAPEQLEHFISTQV